MMRRAGYTAVAVTLAAVGVMAQGQGGARRVSAALEPEQEVPAVSSPAAGEFSAEIDDDGEAVDYVLSYGGLQANVLMSHIHLAQPNVNGSIMVWLCGTAANPGPAGTQQCPQSGTISGTIRPANVGAIATQGIAAGEFAEFVAAMRKGLAYVNVHTVQSPGGEIRGQVRLGDGHK
jgi:hypothetical protein